MQYYIPQKRAEEKKKESTTPSKLYIPLNTNRNESTKVSGGLFGFRPIPSNASVDLGSWLGTALAVGYIDTSKLTNVTGTASDDADTAAGTALVPSGAVYTWTDDDGGTHLMIKN